MNSDTFGISDFVSHQLRRAANPIVKAKCDGSTDSTKIEEVTAKIAV